MINETPFLNSGAALSCAPLVTTIIPAYNHERYVEQALLSAISQTYPNLEIIVIDDGSTDATAERIEQTLRDHSHGRDVTFIRQNNQGLSKTLNKAINLAKGEFIQFLASDDAYLPEKTSTSVHALIHANRRVAGVYSDGYLINDRNQQIARFSDKYPRPSSSNTYRELLIGNWIPALGVLYRKSALQEVGGFDESLAVEDYDFLLRLTKRFALVPIKHRLFLYRWHETNFSKQRDRMAEQFGLIQRKHVDLERFNDFTSSLQRKSFGAIVRNLSYLNLDLLFRKLLRGLQIKHGLDNVGRTELIYLLGKKATRLVIARWNAAMLSLRGVTIGRKSRIHGRIRTIGNNQNIYIGNRVTFLGDATIITTYSRREKQVHIGDDAVIDHNAVIFSLGGDIRIGKACFIGPNVILQANGNICIGDFTMIASNSSVYANNHITELNGSPFRFLGNRFEGISIGKNCWLGANVTILDGSGLGDNITVGAGCVVNGRHFSNSRIIAKAVKGESIAHQP